MQINSIVAPTKRQRLNRQGAIGNNDDEEEAPVAEPEDLAEQLRRKVNMQKLSKDKRDKVCYYRLKMAQTHLQA